MQADSLLSEPPGKPIIPVCHISKILLSADGQLGPLYSLVGHYYPCTGFCAYVCVLIYLVCVARSRISGFYGNSVAHV